jgi:plasmid maintenance system killer protein
MTWMIEIRFRNNELKKLSEGIWDHRYTQGIGARFRAVLAEIEEFTTIHDILTRQGRHAEWKKGDRVDQVWIRLNDGWRLMLKFLEEKNATVLVTLVREVVNYHK